MLEPGKYHLALNAQVLDNSLSVFSVNILKDGRLYAFCEHGSWGMHMWMNGEELVGKIDGWPHTEFHNIRGLRVDSIPENDCAEQISV